MAGQSQIHTVFGDEPDGPLHHAKAIITFMSAAWLSEHQAVMKATQDSLATEFSLMTPRIHADVLETVGCLIEMAQLMMAEARS